MTISAQSLSFHYDQREILRSVSCEVKEGEFIALFGPNGGGKTTFLNLLMGFLKPSSGEVTLFEKKPESARSFVGWVPQGFAYDPSFPISVLDCVLGGRLSALSKWGHFSKADHLFAKEALATVGMTEKLKAPFAELSGGQQQRVLIARALASQPKLLLLDEPTSNLDPTTKQQIYTLLQQLKGKMTILMVTHDLDFAIKGADRLFCIQSTLEEMSPKLVCEHFALGLYHKGSL